MIADTPKPPYYAVIFSAIQSDDLEGYSEMAQTMQALAAKQPGYLGFESASGNPEISISYWKDLESIHAWKQNVMHRRAQKMGRNNWYDAYKTRICKVERDYNIAESPDWEN